MKAAPIAPSTAQRIVDLLMADPGVIHLDGINPRGLNNAYYRIERPCERCGHQFLPAKNNPHARFCSNECYKAALRMDYRLARNRAAAAPTA